LEKQVKLKEPGKVKIGAGTRSRARLRLRKK
jgi:hypothetical protein